jgi:hypothetical protein
VHQPIIHEHQQHLTHHREGEAVTDKVVEKTIVDKVEEAPIVKQKVETVIKDVKVEAPIVDRGEGMEEFDATTGEKKGLGSKIKGAFKGMFGASHDSHQQDLKEQKNL